MQLKLKNLMFIVLCLIMMIILYRQWSQDTSNHFVYLMLRDSRYNAQSFPNNDLDFVVDIFENNKLLSDIERVISDKRLHIAKKMEDYIYQDGVCSNDSARCLAELVPESEGTPIRNIIISTWRSGSTFVGDIFSSHPGTFYYYEPLSNYGNIQIRDGAVSSSALQNIREHFNCNYDSLDDYLEYSKNTTWVLSHNTHLWTQCKKRPRICWLPEFLTRFCKLFPFQLMKTTRLRLKRLKELLDDSSFDIRVLLLVRDPRGTMQSRKHCNWCKGYPDCINASNLCMDLVSDYNTAVEFTKKYSERFRAIRYEDISTKPYDVTRELCNFFRLDFHADIQQFLDTHTKVDSRGQYDTYRNSKSTPFHWRQDLRFDEVESIQNVCMVAMYKWGYVTALNETHQHEFNPIEPFTLV